MVVAHAQPQELTLQPELVAEYAGRAGAIAARELLEAHGIAHADVMLEASPAGQDRLERETLRFDRKTMRHVGSWTAAGTIVGTVLGLTLVGAGVLAFAAFGGPFDVNSAIALLLGGTGGAEAGAFIAATASLPGLPAINANLLASAEPHVFVRVSVVGEQDAQTAVDVLKTTNPDQLRRVAGAVVHA
jgi:hypothetical protein